MVAAATKSSGLPSITDLKERKNQGRKIAMITGDDKLAEPMIETDKAARAT